MISGHGLSSQLNSAGGKPPEDMVVSPILVGTAPPDRLAWVSRESTFFEDALYRVSTNSLSVRSSAAMRVLPEVMVFHHTVK
jgi:hypothetical protein